MGSAVSTATSSPGAKKDSPSIQPSGPDLLFPQPTGSDTVHHNAREIPENTSETDMKFFVDTADIDAISELNATGMVDGVTTNPSLIMKAGRDILEVTKEICDIVDGPVSAEVVATEADDMIAEGRKLAKIAPNITVKVPLTWAGLRACKPSLTQAQMVNVTLCFSANQALLGRQSWRHVHLAFHRTAGRYQHRWHGN